MYFHWHGLEIYLVIMYQLDLKQTLRSTAYRDKPLGMVKQMPSLKSLRVERASDMAK